MTSYHHIQQQFTQALGWNAFSYIIYKILFTTLSFLLLAHLETQDFSLWANTMSITFLLLLWLDLGMRKSIPRFLPEFAHNSKSLNRFVRIILLAKLILVITTLPFFIIALRWLIPQTNSVYIMYAAGIFVLQGLISIIQLIYHAHFWNKLFNSISTLILAGEMALNIMLVFLIARSTDLIQSILLTKLIASTITIISTLILLAMRYQSLPTKHNQSTDFISTFKKFMYHSAIMWASTTLKSLSERNFLQPLLTVTVGAASANIFKVANDGALMFQRSVIKTVGTADTALLAYAQTDQDGKKLVPIAYTKLVQNFAALCFPLLGIFFLIVIYGEALFISPLVFKLFSLLTITHLIEAFLSPYERVLEVRRAYGFLFCAYAPYVILLFLFLTTNLFASAGLLGSIILLYGVRLVSAVAMALIVWMHYQFTFPYSALLRIALLCSAATALVYFLLQVITY